MRHGANKFRNVLTHFYGTPWAILPAKLTELRAVLWRRIEQSADGGNVQLEQFSSGAVISSLPSSPEQRGGVVVPVAFDDGLPQTVKSDNGSGYTLVGSVAVIRVSGVINPRPSIFDEWSGGTSHESVGRATDAAVADGKAESIVYDIDSPGGTVYGMPENAAKVLAARKVKPTTAVVNHVAASAAYWYASQAKEIVTTPAGQAGCIGVLMNSIDETEALKMEGIKDVLVSNTDSPYKSERYPQVPITEEAIAEMRKTCDAYGEQFYSAIAKGRGLRVPTIKADFGRGRMLLPEDALAVRMVDRIGTLQSVVDEYNAAKSKAAKRRVAAELVQLRMPTAKK